MATKNEPYYGVAPKPATSGGPKKGVRRQEQRVAAQQAAKREHQARYGGGKGSKGSASSKGGK